ncbi:MAG TPA: ribonuclease P protein component [Candidatus Peribacteraceae bacterium]|nr:ribonuclease P protein component [Candidatus Peribacteraceae bacterium]
MKLSRLRGRKIVDQVLRKGNVWKGRHMSIRFVFGAPRHPAANVTKGVYMGTLVSAKLDKSAVKRNRMRRRVREALRTTILSSPERPPVQLLILPRSSTLSCTFPELLKDITGFLSVLDSWPQKTRSDRSSSSRSFSR